MSDSLILERHGYFPFFTLGYLILGDQRWCAVEQPWADNKPFQSCIPLGTYDLAPVLHHWPVHPGVPPVDPLPTYEVQNVPNRTGIHLHPANFADEVEGCVCFGTLWQVRIKDNVIGNQNSSVGFRAWYALMQQLNPTQIVVKNTDLLGA